MLVPVLLRAAGRWAWWLPSWMDRLLPNVRFGHVEEKQTEQIPDVVPASARTTSFAWPER